MKFLYFFTAFVLAPVNYNVRKKIKEDSNFNVSASNIPKAQMLNKLSCSLTNSAAVGNEGQIYVWGSGKYGFSGDKEKFLLNSPTDIKFQDYYPTQNLKAIHISCGINHMAAIVVHEHFFDEVHQKLIEKHKEYFKILGDNLEVISSQNIERKITKDGLRNLLMTNSHFKLTDEEKSKINSYIEIFFNTDGSFDIDYYKNLLSGKETYKKAMIWGCSDNCRLGLDDDTIQANEAQEKRTKLTGNLEIESGSSEGEVSINSPPHNPQSKMNLMTNLEFRLGSSIMKSRVLNEPFEVSKEKKNIITDNLKVRPTLLNFSINIIKISCGHQHTLSLDSEGCIHTWGSGTQGCLGTGHLEDKKTPFKLEGDVFENKEIVEFKDICCGSYHSMGLSKSGKVYSWGSSTRGQLGHGSSHMELKPKKLEFFEDKNIEIIIINAGEQHSAAVSLGYELYTWGCGSYYRLGHGSSCDDYLPKKVEVLEDVYVTKVSCGTSHTLCVTNEGFIYAWGSGMCGKLGMQENYLKKNCLIPTRVGIYLKKFRRKNFQEVCAGPLHSMALSKEGKLFAWGSHKNSVLGLGKLQNDRNFPSQIKNFWFFEEKCDNKKTVLDFKEILYLKQVFGDIKLLNETSKNIIQMCSAEKNTLFLSNEGQVYVCGSAARGILTKDPVAEAQAYQKQQFEEGGKQENLANGIGASKDNKQNKTVEDFREVYKPIHIKFFSKTKIKFIACSYNHAIAISHKGVAYSWGTNTEYQLGLGYSSKVNFTPSRIQGPLEMKTIVLATCSDKFSAILTDNGEVWTFGSSENGTLGHEEKNSYIIINPKMINDIEPMIYITCGPEMMMAIDSGKRGLWAWGNNTYGQLGIPQKSNILENGKEVGSIRVFKPRKVPLICDNGKEFKVRIVSCGLFHSVLINDEHILYATGLKKYAGLEFLNDSNTNEIADYFQVIKFLNGKHEKFRAISCGEFHTLAITKKKEYLYGWGSVSFGKLAKLGSENVHLIRGDEKITFEKRGGNEDMRSITKPKEIPLKNKENKKRRYIQVSCGPYHSCVLDSLGTAYAMGSAVTGKLGISKQNLNKLIKKSPQIGAEKDSFSTFYVEEIHKIEFRKRKEAETKADLSSDRAYSHGSILNEYQPKKSKIIDENILSHSPNALPSPNKYITEKKFSFKGANESKKKEEVMINSEDESRTTRSDEIVEESSEQESKDTSDELEIEDSVTPNKSVSKIASDTSGINQNKNNKQNRFDFSLSNKNSRIGKGHQNELQKTIISSGAELREEALMAEDNELEKEIKTNISKNFITAWKLRKKYSILWSRADMKIFSALESVRTLTGASSASIPKVPSFILQNIQLYEAFFSFLHLHPCYLFKIIQSQLLSLSQIKNLISILYSNNCTHQNSKSALLSLALMVFDYECSLTLFLSDLKNFRVGNTFWEIYKIFIKKDTQAMKYLIGCVTRFINEIMCKRLDDYCGSILNQSEIELIRNGTSRDRFRRLFKTIKLGICDTMNKEAENMVKDTQDVLEDKKNAVLVVPSDLADIYKKIRDKLTPKSKISLINDIVKSFFEDLKQEIDYVLNAQLDLISSELSHLHSSLINIYIEKEKRKGYKSHFKDNQLDLMRVEEQKMVEGIIDRIKVPLLKKGKDFIFTLFFGVFLEIFSNLIEYKIPINKNYQVFVQKGSNNVKILSEIIACAITNTKYSELEIYQEINTTLVKPRESLVSNFCSKLAVDIYFNLSMSHLRESLLNSFDYRVSYFEISLELLINMHNLFCDVIRKGSESAFEELFIREKEDPLYIIFEYLEFRSIPAEKMSADMLRMKINLKYCESVIDFKSPEFHKCPCCKILLPLMLLPKEIADQIQNYQKGWKCKKCGRDNKFTSFKCINSDCPVIIEQDMFIHHSIIEKFYPETDDLVKEYFELITKLDYFKEDEEMWDVFQRAIAKFRKKDEVVNEIRFKNFMMKCIDIKEKETEKFKSKMNEVNQKDKEDAENMNYFKEKIKEINKKAKKVLEARKRHREYQLYLKNFLSNTKFLLKEKQLLFNTAIKSISDIETTTNQIFPRENNEKNLDLDLKDEENVNEVMNTSLPIGVYTFNELKNKKALISLKFSNKDLPIITKHLKFYIMSTEEGGFLMNLVHTSEHWLNIFTSFIKRYFLNEVKLQTLEIELERYIEMKRTCNFQARCTFGKFPIMATFDLTNLVTLLRQIESQVMVNSWMSVMRRKLADAPPLKMNSDDNSENKIYKSNK